MLLVLGSVQIQRDHMDEASRVSQAHVERSRAEPGCLERGVHRSHDQPDRLVFLKRWAAAAALQAHLGVPASRRFAKALFALAAAPLSMQVYATLLPVRG